MKALTADSQGQASAMHQGHSAWGQPKHPDARRVAASNAASDWAIDVLAETVPEFRWHPFELELLRSGAKRLAILRSDAVPSLVLKQYSDHRGASTAQWLRRLSEAGLAPPASYAVTPPRGWSGRHRTLVTELAPGRPWMAWTLADPACRTTAAVAVAHWLVELQSLTVELPECTTHRAGGELQRDAALLADRFPHHAARLHALAGGVASRLYAESGAGAAVPLVASHGDLHPHNLHLELGERLTVTAIDVDTAGLRRPSYDVGYGIAQLLILSWLRTGSFATGAAAGSAFWHTWAVTGADADAVAPEIARALVQSLHFELITYQTGRTELIDGWLTVAEAALAVGVPATLQALADENEVVR